MRLPRPDEWDSLVNIHITYPEKFHFRDIIGNNFEKISDYNLSEVIIPLEAVAQNQKWKYPEYYKNPLLPFYTSPLSKTNALFHLYRNASEMTSVFGIAKGGNYTSTTNELQQIYTKAENWLGFRCVYELVIRKKDNYLTSHN